MKINKNIAHLIVGISYGEKNRDFRHCFPNIKANLLDPFEKDYINSWTYLFTYENEFESELINLYKPKAIETIPFKGSDQVTTKIKSLEMMRKYQGLVDFIVMSRFDIHYNNDLLNNSNLQWDFSKFNFLCKERGWWDNAKFTNDCIYAFPYIMLEQAIAAFKILKRYPPRLDSIDTHGLWMFLEPILGEEYINFMTESHHISNTNEIYSLCRSDSFTIPRLLNKEVAERKLKYVEHP